MKLNPTELNTRLADLPQWTLLNGKLHRDFAFADFAHAIGFITTAALKIEALDHHPEWANVYNRVSVDLVSHSAGGITMKDLALAAILDQLAQPFA